MEVKTMKTSQKEVAKMYQKVQRFGTNFDS